MLKKIICFAGTRPEAIKLAPVIRELRASPKEFEVRLCSSGQHKELLYQALSDFGIRPDEDLAVMQPGQSLAGLCSSLFEAIDSCIERERPDWVLVQGDTTTVMAASLCAFYRRIKIGHVEAGLRSLNRFAPFPEEINRRVAGLVADLHFAPTEEARGNLLREGVPSESVIVTGNTAIDALLWMVELVRRNPPPLPLEVTHALSEGRKLVLVTGHRRESFGPGLQNICRAIKELAGRYRKVLFVYPVHLNPEVQKPVNEILGTVNGVLLTPPLSYKPFVRLMDASHLILTDSGGIQEEGPSLGKPVLVMREVTERPEGIAAGTSRLVGTTTSSIVRETRRLLDDRKAYQEMAKAKNPYGDGKAAKRIKRALAK